MKTGVVCEWFLGWHKTRYFDEDNSSNAQPMYSCSKFGAAQEFLTVTHDIVVIPRCRLRNILLNGLLDRVETLLDSEACECCFKTVYNYLKELKRIKVWPLEKRMKNANINDLLARLKNFDDANVSFKEQNGCHLCSKSWLSVVSEASRKVREYFDGLYLDCMAATENSKSRSRPDDDDDYWGFGSYHHRYDRWCPVTHGEPTWYFRNMGIREKEERVSD
ncbi:hypothetical protein BDV19DRAFT_385364 [Aspergillus venezuelensis]